MKEGKGNITEKLSKFLFKYRITPHSTTGIPPAELLMGRKIRPKLDLLQPNLTSKVQQSQMAQKKHHDVRKPYCQFVEGDLVYAENFSNNSEHKWLPGSISKVTGPLSCIIELLDGKTVRRHIDHIKAREEQSSNNDTNWDYVDSGSAEQSNTLPHTTAIDEQSTLRRSTRSRHPPQRFDASQCT